jgi:hypothetical protein
MSLLPDVDRILLGPGPSLTAPRVATLVPEIGRAVSCIVVVLAAESTRK